VRFLDQSEKTLLIAAAGYSRSRNISLTKIAWALSSILQKPENNVYHQLKEIDNNLDTQLTEIYGIKCLSSLLEDDAEVEDDLLETKLGEIVNVEVLSVKTFGAICKVENTSRTLLLHLSEVTDQFINDLSKYLKEGDKIQAMLILNPRNELGLSTRRIKSVPAEEDYQELYKKEG
jgi:predicted RNA-binding protein with RPS1 domain